jgi:hypothetical protein
MNLVHLVPTVGAGDPRPPIACITAMAESVAGGSRRDGRCSLADHVSGSVTLHSVTSRHRGATFGSSRGHQLPVECAQDDLAKEMSNAQDRGGQH